MRADEPGEHAGDRAGEALALRVPATRSRNSTMRQQVDRRAGDHRDDLGAAQHLGRVGDHELVADGGDDDPATITTCRYV